MAEQSTAQFSADDVPASLKRMVEIINGMTENKTTAKLAGPVEYGLTTSACEPFISPGHVISMIDGKSYRSKRGLETALR